MWIFGTVVFIWVVICVLLILVILIQSDKGGGLSGAFGGGMSSAQALLGTQDTKNILTRATTILASLFMGICIILSLILANFVNKVDAKSALRMRAEKQDTYSPASILQPGGLPVQSESQQAGQEGQAAPAQQAPATEIPQGVPLPIQQVPPEQPAPKK
jgi:preprotein translocase subunit SecG